jgi:hypothetical protein
MMKCPGCQSENFHVFEEDILLMSCIDCDYICSVPFAIGYWRGYYDHKSNNGTVCYLCSSWVDVNESIDTGKCKLTGVERKQDFYCADWARAG